MSFPEIREKVVRAAHVKVRAQDEFGKWFEVDGEELLSRCLQHEIDHLDGDVVYISHQRAETRSCAAQDSQDDTRWRVGLDCEVDILRNAKVRRTTLEALIGARHEIQLVVTQPDRPVGRERRLHAPPVKVIAEGEGLRVVQPEKIKNNSEFEALLREIAPDAIVVVAYGRIIPKWMLDLPKFGCINLHASLLPKYRGAAPIQWAVASGESETGNTTMLLEEGLDTGPILLQQKVTIGPTQTAADLFEILSVSGATIDG